MKYSLIIPAYQGAATLPRLLDSIPVRRDLEVILVNDGSSDETPDIARRYGVRLIEQPHLGVAAARNRGMAAARGEFLCFADSDDRLAADYFDVLDAAPDCDLLIFDLKPGLAKRLRHMDKTGKIDLLLRTDKLTSSCTKRIRRSFWERFQAQFPEGMQVGEDFCFALALALEAETVEGMASCIYHADLSNENSLSRGYRPRLAEDMQDVFAIAAQPGALLPTLDDLHARRCLTCLAELWKGGRPGLADVRRVCGQFRRPIHPQGRSLLRRALNRHLDGLLMVGAWLWKGWKFQFLRRKNREKTAVCHRIPHRGRSGAGAGAAGEFP